MGLTYCPRCNKLFARGIREVCNNCVKEIEKEYEKVVAYLKENKGANIQQTSDDTEITIKQITKFIREGRLGTANMRNMSIPCEVCGLPIREGNMCDSCRSKLQRDMKNLKPSSSGSAAVAKPETKTSGAYQIRDRR